MTHYAIMNSVKRAHTQIPLPTPHSHIPHQANQKTNVLSSQPQIELWSGNKDKNRNIFSLRQTKHRKQLLRMLTRVRGSLLMCHVLFRIYCTSNEQDTHYPSNVRDLQAPVEHPWTFPFFMTTPLSEITPFLEKQ